MKLYSSVPSLRKKQVYYTWQLVAAIFRLATSLYLSVQHTRLKLGIQDGKSFCSLGGYADCDIVSGSQYSEIFGIPLGTIGALYFCILLIIGILFSPEDKNFHFGQRVLALLAVFALAIDFLPLLAVQLFLIKSLCLMCLFTYVVTLVHLYLNARLQGEKGSIFQCLKSSLTNKTAFNKKQLSTPKLALSSVFLLMFLVILFLLPSFIKSGSSDYANVDNSVEKFFLGWKNLPQKKFPVEPTDGTYGNPNARVQFVEFSDFECPFCRKMAFQIHSFLPSVREKVHFIFKHYPLDTNCNPKLTYQMHAYSCRLARISTCCVKSDRFWQFHDKLFLSMTDEDMKAGWDEIEKNITKVISKEEIDLCLKNPKSLESVAANVNLGNQLNLQGTPTLFINGKEVTIPKTPENLKRLIELELEI